MKQIIETYFYLDGELHFYIIFHFFILLSIQYFIFAFYYFIFHFGIFYRFYLNFISLLMMNVSITFLYLYIFCI